MSKSIEPMLPQNIEAEMAVLGSIIIDPESIGLVADSLQPDHFYRDAHQTIYAAMLWLLARQTPADSLTLKGVLAQQGKLEAIGGAFYLNTLVGCTPTSGNIEYYARMVWDHAIRRRLIHGAGQIAEHAYHHDDAEGALELAEQTIYEISVGQEETDFVEEREVLDDLMLSLLNSQHVVGAITGIPTGFRDIDYLLAGLQKTDLIIVAARPAMGKSSFALSIAAHAVLQAQKRVAICSLEMSKEQLMQRLLSMESRVELFRLRNRDIANEEWEQLEAAHHRLTTGRLLIDDTAGLSIAALKTKLRRMMAKKPLDLVIVDYLQLMTVSSMKPDNRVLIIGEITKGLKAIAKELNVPILALAQLSRDVEKRVIKIPQMSDLRESGSIENDADVILFIYRDEVYNPDTERKGQADIIIAKHRNGPTGEIALKWEGAYTQFSNLDFVVEGSIEHLRPLPAVQYDLSEEED